MSDLKALLQSKDELINQKQIKIIQIETLDKQIEECNKEIDKQCKTYGTNRSKLYFNVTYNLIFLMVLIVLISGMLSRNLFIFMLTSMLSSIYMLYSPISLVNINNLYSAKIKLRAGVLKSRDISSLNKSEVQELLSNI